MKTQNNRAFTLVELIVVITILAVLATVAFISFQGYASLSRDSVRLADLKNISKSFEINRTKNIDFPLPDKKVDISSSGTIFQYQGELSQNILESDLNIFDGWLDPVTDQPYGYAINAARNKFQIIWFLENQESVTNVSLTKTFADNTDKYVKSSWDALGILLDETNNEIILDDNETLEIDIESDTNTYKMLSIQNEIILADKETLQWQFLSRFNPNASCKTLLESWNSKWSGMYFINPTNTDWEEFEVYCDMGNHWGGWTLVWEWLPSEAIANLQTNEKLALSGSIVFQEIYANPYHLPDYHIERLSNTAILDRTFRKIYNDLDNVTDALDPRALFTDLNWNQTTMVNNMLYWYGNSFRIFANGRNIAYTNQMYICNPNWSDVFTQLTPTERIELWIWGTHNCYPWDPDNYDIKTSSWLSIAQWQEVKVYVR